jgi:hypothetical protein
MFCLCRGPTISAATAYRGERGVHLAGKAVQTTLNIAQETNIFLGDETRLVRFGILGNQPALTMSIRDPDHLAFNEWKLILVLALEVEKSNGLTMHFLVRRCNGELIVARVSGIIPMCHSR